MVVFSLEKEENSKKFAIYKRCDRKKNGQISQNRTRFRTFEIALSASESLLDLK